MNLRWGTIVLVAGLFATGCGTDEELEAAQEQGRAMQQAFGPIQADMATLGSEVGAAVEEAAGQADRQVAQTFESLSERMEKQAEQVRALEAPESEVPERDELASALEKGAATLGEAADAAREGDEAQTAQELQELVTQSQAISEAQGRLEGALRSLLGSGS